MKTNKRYVLKEADEASVSVQNLISMAEKIEQSIIPLVNGCVEYNEPHLKGIAMETKQSIDKLGTALRSLLSSEKNSSETEKSSLEAPPSSEKIIGEGIEKIVERLFKNLIKEAQEEAKEEKEEEKEEGEKTEEKVEVKEINLSDAFESILEGLDEDVLDMFKDKIKTTLTNSGFELGSELMTELENADVDSINEWLNKLYDYADANDILVIALKEEGE